MAVYRFDYLAQHWKIPFVPYFKIGLAYYVWWIENGGGFLSIAQYTPPGATSSQGGWGGTFGWVMNPGGAFLLDVLDPSAAKTIDAELGINHTYLFCEFHYADIRYVATGSVNALTPTWIRASMNPATGNGGTCYGDSGGPNFLGDTNIIAGTTITGDFVCRATNVDYRLDTPSARTFLGQFVTLP